jgi:hypothetical protein
LILFSYVASKNQQRPSFILLVTMQARLKWLESAKHCHLNLFFSIIEEDLGGSRPFIITFP